MIFTPINRTDDFSTLSHGQLVEAVSRAAEGAFEDGNTIVAASLVRIETALGSGQLTAYVQAGPDPMFYKVPCEHWIGGDFIEGSALDELFCWSNSTVPAKFHNAPLLFFADEAELWLETLPPLLLADDWDFSSVQSCLDRASLPRGGYWSLWEVLAWISGRDERFVAAAQLYANENLAGRGGEASAAAWMDLGNAAGFLFEKTFEMASEELRESLESADGLAGGVALDRYGERIEIPRHAWLDWRKSFENEGVILVPGYRSYSWPSEVVQAVFPAPSQPVPHPAPRVTDAEILAACDALWLDGVKTRDFHTELLNSSHFSGLTVDAVRLLTTNRYPRVGKGGRPAREKAIAALS